jgi:hypothetical protein
LLFKRSSAITSAPSHAAISPAYRDHEVVRAGGAAIVQRCVPQLRQIGARSHHHGGLLNAGELGDVRGYLHQGNGVLIHVLEDLGSYAHFSFR